MENKLKLERASRCFGSWLERPDTWRLVATTIRTEAILGYVCSCLLPEPCVISGTTRDMEVFFQSSDMCSRRRTECVDGFRNEKL